MSPNIESLPTKKKLCEFAINYFPLSNARLGPQILPSAAQRRQRAGGRPASQAMPLRPLPPARTFQRKRSFHPKALSTFPPFSSRCARAVRPLPPRPSRNKFSLNFFFAFFRVIFAFFSLSYEDQKVHFRCHESSSEYESTFAPPVVEC